VCAQLQFNICKETGIKLDIEHWYEHVPKLVETNREGKATVLWKQQCRPSEPSLTMNRTL